MKQGCKESYMRRVVARVALLLCAVVQMSAQQGGLSLQANPTLQIPLGPTLSEEIQYYTIGGGFSLTGEYAFPFAPMFSPTQRFNSSTFHSTMWAPVSSHSMAESAPASATATGSSWSSSRMGTMSCTTLRRI